MKPILFTIGNLEVHSLVVFIALGFIVFAFLLWKNLRTVLNKNTIFDIVLFSLVFSPIIGRLAYLLKYFPNYVNNGWNLLPVRDRVAFFDAAPWNFFAIWDSGIYVHFVPIAVIVAVNLGLSLSKKKIALDKIMANVWKSFIPAHVILLVAFLLDGSYLGKSSSIPLKVLYEGENEARLAVQIIEIIVLLAIAIFYIDVKNKTRLLNMSQTVLFPVIWSISEVLLWFKVEQYRKDFFIFDAVQLVWIIALVIFLINLVSKKMKDKNTDGMQEPANLRQRNKPRKNIPLKNAAWAGRYNLNKNFSTDLSLGEKLKMRKNRLRRGI